MTNILIAISNLIENPIRDLVSYYRSTNRANNMGDALELYVKDIFCNSTSINDINEKNRIYEENFSYIGNQNNPPDIIIKGGDAIEVKKIESIRSSLALNSSYPKDKLHSNNPMITSACRECEQWDTKDIIYTIGVSNNNHLKALWMIYGDCYAANKETYEEIRDRISRGINNLPDVEFSETNEIARINRVDPLGITYFRLRGMWGIENPIKVFNYVAPIDENAEFNFNAIILTEKYTSFSEVDRQRIEGLVGENFSIRDVQIKSPNNPARLLNAKILTFKL